MNTTPAWYQQVPWDIGGEKLPEWIHLLEGESCTQANLTHHLSGTTEVALLQTIPNSLSWTIHLSSRSLAKTSLDAFLEHIQAISNLRELLVVSGNPRLNRTSFDVLDSLSQRNLPYSLAVAVSPDDSFERISRKCSYAAVSRAYLQLAEPEHWQPLVRQIRSLRSDIEISACWLPPTPANWKALTLFPWKGSLLSNEWKNSLEYTQACAQFQLDWMKQNGVTPLIEPRRITKDLLATIKRYEL